ncbi:MAG: chromosomal replication initiator protein DnaA [Prevotellaceae bacterium]|jgi:chromosomal replication initiator protein|nr:chromosomal replication initiator protein DnaA [Prevotellaceae bacterium]
MKHIALWDKCLGIIRDNVSQAAYDTWFMPIVPLSYQEDEFILQVPSQFFYEYIEEKYIDLLRQILYRVVGEGTQLKYRILMDRASQTVTDIPSTKKPAIAAEKKEVHNPFALPQLQDIDPHLNPHYTFATFIEGKANNLARSAGLKIAEMPGNTPFNPLFLHGNSGVGKTHLAHAIGIETKERFPEKRVLYVSANLFQQQYTEAQLKNKINDFLNFYQTIDVLIVDDIHEFAGKTGTQNTFFHIFNHLHQSRKQIIFTCDRSPAMLQGMEQRLLTRFKFGLTAEMQQPDFELRRAILKAKIYRDGLEISDDVIDYIAENVTENIRDLEGVIVSLLAHSTLGNVPIDLALAENIIGKLVEKTPVTITIEKIKNLVCDYFSLKLSDILTKSRKREVVQARQIAMYLAKEHTKHPLAKIGMEIGNRDHATVLHACKTVKDLMQTDRNFKNSVITIEARVKCR